MSIFKRISAAATLTVLTLTVVGCVPLSSSGANSAALEKLKQNPMPGFSLTASSKGDSFCVLASYCTSNASAQFTADKPYATRMELCKDLLAWAPMAGADAWLYDPDYIALPIKGHEGSAQFACIGANNYSLVGSSGEVRWMLSPTLDSYSVATIMSNEGGLDDQRMDLKTWDDAKSQLFEGTRLHMDILSALETFRLQNPKLNPSKPSTVDAALNAMELPKGSEILLDDSGSAHYLYLPSDGFMLERCLNIKPFSEDYFQMPNPGSGFVGLYLLEGQPRADEFGYLDSAKCPGQQ